jgi:uncharacterized membrane protein
MLTNGEHDRLWRNMVVSIPDIRKALDRANAIACIKELYSIGEISKEDYSKSLISIMGSAGYYEKK